MADRVTLRNSLKKMTGSRTDDFTDAEFDVFLADGLLDLGTRRLEIRQLQAVGTPIASVIGAASYSVSLASPDTFTINYLVDTVNKKVIDYWDGTFEDFLRAQQNEMPTVETVPDKFIVYGTKLYVFQTPQVNTISWLPYIYKRARFVGSGDAAVPNVEEEWHDAIKILAKKRTFVELGDDERAANAENEFMAWVNLRDTPNRQQKRYKATTRGVRPHPSMVQSRLGV